MLKKFIGNWESYPAYPIPTAESHGVLFGSTDFVVFSGFSGGYRSVLPRKVYAYNCTNTTSIWRPMDDIPIMKGITHAAYATVGTNQVYICGGYIGKHPGLTTDQCWVYLHTNPPGTQWNPFPSLPEPRAGGALLYSKARHQLLYVSGASRPDPNDRLYTIDRDDVWMIPLSNNIRLNSTWIPKPKYPAAANHIGYISLYSSSSTSSSGKATNATSLLSEHHYVLGGQQREWESNSSSNIMYEWNFYNETWVQRANLTIGRGHFTSSTVAINGTCGFLIIGGTLDGGIKTRDISYYDRTNATWTSIGTLPSKFGKTNACIISIGTSSSNMTASSLSNTSNSTTGTVKYLYCQTGLINGIFSWRRRIV